MGIEPTEPKVNLGPNGFEDRGPHQWSKHFRSLKDYRSNQLNGVKRLKLNLAPCD
jgi:hypothetical protein